MGKRYPICISDFKELASGDFYFVDKTMMIADLCQTTGVTFIYTRPRRFGKSINLSMLDCFFNLRYKGGKDFFAGTRISECHMCNEHRNRYPVIRLNLASVDANGPGGTYGGLKVALSYVAADIKELVQSSPLEEWEMQRISDLEQMRADYAVVQTSIRWISSLLEKLYGEKVIILVDEYDHCIHDISDPAKFEETSNIMRGFMQESFKLNEHIKFGVAMGVMTVLQTGMFSGFNNPIVCDIFSTEGDEYFGFTEEEVVKLLDDSGVDRCHLEEIREWYDGYRFGNADVYNPLSVNRYLKDGYITYEYWNKTTKGGLSLQLISNLDFGTMVTLKQLVVDRSASVESVLDDRIVYADIIGEDVEPSKVYSYLVMGGYLKAVYMRRDDTGHRIYKISSVNKEVAMAFEEIVKRVDRMQKKAPIDLPKDIYDGNADNISKDIMILLSGRNMDKTWDHDRYKELIGSVLSINQMMPVDEMPKGLGKVDIFIKKAGPMPAVAIEIKTSSKEPAEVLAAKAMNAILEKGYASEPMDGDVISIGIGIRIKEVSARVIMPGEY